MVKRNVIENNKLLERLFKVKEDSAIRYNENDGEFIEKIGINRRKRIKRIEVKVRKKKEP